MFKISYLSFKNNFSKFYFPFFTMFFAAFLMTGSLSFQTGHLAYERLGPRQAFGGDIVLYHEEYILDQPAEGRYYYREYGEHYSDLASYLPKLSYEGFISSGRTSKIAEIMKIDGVASIRPSLMMPVKFGERTILLRARNLEDDRVLGWDNPGLTPILKNGGQYFTQNDEMTCLVPLGKGFADQPGEKITVHIPAIKYDSNGKPHFDFTNMLPVELTVKGVFNVMVREVSERTGSGGDAVTVRRPIYWDPQGVLIPEGTWLKLYQMAGGRNAGDVSEHLSLNNQLVIRAEDPLFARDLIRQIKNIDPQVSVMSVLDLDSYTRLTMGQGGPALSMDQVFVVLVFAVSGLIVASNMYLSVMKRKKEIAILKALGAGNGAILLMILLEVLLISLAGSLSGYLFVRGFITLILLVNRISLSVIASLSLKSLSVIVGATTGLGVAFGLIPAFKAANLTVMEVLRNE